jgi:c(7)-type cytochrome triheme protein
VTGAAQRALFAAAIAASALALGGAIDATTALAPGDILMDEHSSVNGMPPVVFPHWAHRQEFRCYACHPKPFEMRRGANAITMAGLRSGEFCGACHDGETAFEVGFNTCRTCHSHEGP